MASNKNGNLLVTNGQDAEKVKIETLLPSMGADGVARGGDEAEARSYQAWRAAEIRRRQNGPKDAQGRPVSVQFFGSDFHGLTPTDNLVINGVAPGVVGEKAWHGLGLNVLGIEDPLTLLRMGKLDWEVNQLPLYAAADSGGQDGETISVDSHVLNVRSDNNGILGVVGKGYKPAHNSTLIDLVTSLNHGSVVETIGTIQGGRRVFILVRGDSFAVRPKDITTTYLMIAAGHDGSMAINAMWTGVRACCKNSMRRAFAGKQRSFFLRHEGNLEEKIATMKQALGLVENTSMEAAAEAVALDKVEMNTKALEEFWGEVYAKTEGEIPVLTGLKDKELEAAAKKRERAVEVLAEWRNLFVADRARVDGGATMWTALNAVTEWYDHNRPVRGKDDNAREDARIYGSLWGQAADRKDVAREVALASL